jgi:hypothetical protein
MSRLKGGTAEADDGTGGGQKRLPWNFRGVRWIVQGVALASVWLCLTERGHAGNFALGSTVGDSVTDGALAGGRFVTQAFPGGTGPLDPFLQLQANGSEVGHNFDATSASAANDEKTGGDKTEAIQLSEVPYVEIGGIKYIQITLDINEALGGSNPTVELTAFQVFTNTAAAVTYDYAANSMMNPVEKLGGFKPLETVTDLGVLRYDLNRFEANIITINPNNAGSGNTDVEILVPLEGFMGALLSDYVYVWAEFNLTGSGFEEFALRSTTSPTPMEITQDMLTPQGIPEPTGVLLVGLGLVVAVCRRDRGKRRGCAGGIYSGGGRGDGPTEGVELAE